MLNGFFKSKQETIENYMYCQSCKLTPNKVYECDSCGCPYCEKCSLKITCKLCKSKEFSISKFGSLLIESIPIPCQYCKAKVSKKDIEKHYESDCNDFELKCRIPNCKQVIKRKDFFAHLINKHEKELGNYIEDKNNNTPKSLVPHAKPKAKPNFSSQNISLFPKELNNITFPNGKNTYTHSGNTFLTMTCGSAINAYSSIKIWIKHATSPGHVVVGFSSKYLNEKKGYLGGEFGKDNWGIAGNASLGEEGKWKKGLSYKQGDIVELIFNPTGSKITYNVMSNSVPNTYVYTMSNMPKSVFFACTVYHDKTCLVII